ncbi:hypothetical protein D9611_000506 [Ephemerocybe angulata]|uniref:Uncharacterized protein n=1 Tax=Ephemerocybe angulata TaxID=980116 RepID=A0A8H5BM46_9AGAR|nr:hypothetical protein D9611_000506 [Tulosesus angulatus]
MKINCALVASLLIGVCDLLTGVRAYSDYNAELDARDNIDYLSMRDFAYDYQDLDAREPATIEVPFDLSLRDFLRNAAAMHRRGLLDKLKVDKPIGTIKFAIDEMFEGKVEIFEKDTGAKIKEKINVLAKKGGFKLPNFYTLRVGESDKGRNKAAVLGDDALFRSVIPKKGDLGPIEFWGVPPAGEVGRVNNRMTL